VLGVIAVAPWRSTALLLRADQADPGHADAAGHRRPDPHDRRRRGREHRDLRAREGGDRAPGARSVNGIAAGYRKGFSAIIDANVVTIMTAFILFVLSTADVKGFAFTLGIGTLVSLFTAVPATQAILGTMGDSRASRSPERARRRRAPATAGRSTSWAPRSWFFSDVGVILLIGALAIGGRG
jgi:uncharacterized membrane protein YdfJ with MMPL/SSD domain